MDSFIVMNRFNSEHQLIECLIDEAVYICFHIRIHMKCTHVSVSISGYVDMKLESLHDLFYGYGYGCRYKHNESLVSVKTHSSFIQMSGKASFLVDYQIYDHICIDIGKQPMNHVIDMETMSQMLDSDMHVSAIFIRN